MQWHLLYHIKFWGNYKDNEHSVQLSWQNHGRSSDWQIWSECFASIPFFIHLMAESRVAAGPGWPCPWEWSWVALQGVLWGGIWGWGCAPPGHRRTAEGRQAHYVKAAGKKQAGAQGQNTTRGQRQQRPTPLLWTKLDCSSSSSSGHCSGDGKAAICCLPCTESEHACFIHWTNAGTAVTL